MVFGKELSGQISFTAAEFYAKDFGKQGIGISADALPLLFYGTVFGYFGFAARHFADAIFISMVF